MKKIMFLLTTFVFASPILFAQPAYTPVDAESNVHFVIKNFSIKTGGDFTGIKGVIRFDPANYAAAYFNVTVDANTIDTDNSSRDKSLRKAEYFDVEKFKTLQFVSTKVVLSSLAGRYYMYGNLTIKGITRPVDFGFGASSKNGGYVFEGEFKINRRDFGVGGSSISMSDDLTVSLSVFAK